MKYLSLISVILLLAHTNAIRVGQKNHIRDDDGKVDNDLDALMDKYDEKDSKTLKSKPVPKKGNAKDALPSN